MSTDAGTTPPRLHSLARLRSWTIAAWAVIAVANLVAAVLPYRMYLLFTAERPLAELPLARLIFFEPSFRAGLGLETVVGLAREQPLRASLVLFVLYLIASPLLMAFLFRVHRGLASGPAPPPRFAAHWTITGFLVPFANLALPFLVVRDLWRSSAADPEGQATAASASPLPRLWWEVWILGVVLGAASGFLLLRDPLAWAGLLIAAYLLNALAAVLTIVLVRGLFGLLSARATGTAPRAPLGFLPRSLALDAAVLVAIVLAVGLGQRHTGRRVDESFARIVRERAARETQPVATELAPPAGRGEPAADMPVRGPIKVAVELPQPVEREPDVEGVEEGVPGGVEGGIAGGVLGGIEPQGEAAPPADDGPLRVGGDVLAPVKTAGDPPRYPDAARAARLQGIVILEIVIDRTGEVADTRVLKGLPMGLDAAAVEAVRTWKFRPATLHGKPVAVYFTVPVSFRLG
jgi:TonB family protein